MKSPFLRLLSVICAMVLLIASCNLPSKTAPEAGGVKKTTTVELLPGGAAVELDEIVVELSSSNISSGTTLTINRSSSEPVEDVQTLAQSDTYEITNLPVDFDGEIQVVFEIPREVLSSLDKTDPDQANKISLMAGVDGYSRTAGGEVNLFLPVLDAQVDLDAKTITTTLKQMNDTQADLDAKLASKIPINRNAQFTYWDITPNSVRFKVVTNALSWNHTSYATEHGSYNIYFQGGDFGASLDALMHAVDKTEEALTALKFKPVPLNIYVGNPGSGNDGAFSYSSYYGYNITIKPTLVKGERPNEPLLTYGHEMLHYMQLLSYPNGVDRDSFTSLDEATAVWFESFVSGNENYRSGLADQHLVTAMSTPWFSGGSVEMQRAGYGASWYVQYLVRNYGTDFIKQAYSGTHMTGQVSWSMGMMETFNELNEREFPKFLADLYIHPEKVSSGLTEGGSYYGDLFKNYILLKSTDDVQVSFSPNGEGIPKDANTMIDLLSGTISGERPPDPYTIEPVPTLILNRTLSPWNGYAFSIKMDASLHPYDEGQLDVRLTNGNPGSGMMIFAVPLQGFLNNAVAIKGPDDVMTGESFDPIVVNSVSTGNNTGKYKEVFFILFNAGDNDADMTVQVEFKPIQSTLLRGTLNPTNMMFRENPCAALSNCYPYANPPACVSESAGGMGDCGESCTVPLPCPQVPEFCYWCSQTVGASQFAGGYVDSSPSLAFTLNKKGEIEPFESPFTYQPVDPDIQYGSGGTFTMTWIENDINQQPYITVTIQGTIDHSGGSGSWRFDYSGVGTMFSGDWQMAPSSY